MAKEKAVKTLTQVLGEQRTEDAFQREAKPVNPCAEGHRDWDEKRNIYSIDHHSWIKFCKTCDMQYVFQPNATVGIALPDGLIE